MREKLTKSSLTSSAQTGAVLIVGLVILLVMTMLGLTAMQSTSLQERMAGNFRDRDIAFQFSEGAIREGERIIAEYNEKANGVGLGNGYHPAQIADKDFFSNEIWSAGKSFELDVSNKDTTPPDSAYFPPVSDSPKVVVEKFPNVKIGDSIEMPPPDGYKEPHRITARGSGARIDSVVILRSAHFRIQKDI